MNENTMNASWKGKITLSTEYMKDTNTIREISATDEEGMWKYKNVLDQIVIEKSKTEKTGEKVYGPFDESEYGTKAVESYVVCEADNENCVGYLQSEGKIIANQDSSYLFAGFVNTNTIENFKNLDTSQVTIMNSTFGNMMNLTSLDLSTFNTINVTSMQNLFAGVNNATINFNEINTKNVENMYGMFANSKFTELDLSNWDTNKVENMIGMFSGMNSLENLNISNIVIANNNENMLNNLPNLQTLTLTNVNTSKVTNMAGMFFGLSKVSTLDLSDFDTSKVENMTQMFGNTTSLQSIIFGSKFVHNVEATTTGMFSGCPSEDRPTDESWQDVSF